MSDPIKYQDQQPSSLKDNFYDLHLYKPSSLKDNFYDLHLYKPVAEADHQLMELANTFVDIPISAHIAFCCDSVRMTLFFTRQQG